MTQEGIIEKKTFLIVNNIKIMLLGDLFAGYIASAKGCFLFTCAAFPLTEIMESHI